MTINELRMKRNQAWEAAKAFVETKRNKDGLLAAEDTRKRSGIRLVPELA